MLKSAAVKAPGFGDRRKAMLQDMAVLTGGQLISEELGFKLEDVELEQLGRAQRVVVDKDTTTIIGGAGERRTRSKAASQMIRKEIDKTTSDYDREKLEERLGEARGRRRRDPRRCAVGIRDEVEEGRARRRDQLDQGRRRRGHRPGRRARAAALRARRSTRSPRKLQRRRAHRRADSEARARGADAPDRGELGGRWRRRRRTRCSRAAANVGFDAARNRYVDLFEAGIVDPTKVVRIALENAVSVASVLLLTEATMTEKPEKREERTPAESPM